MACRSHSAGGTARTAEKAACLRTRTDQLMRGGAGEPYVLGVGMLQLPGPRSMDVRRREYRRPARREPRCRRIRRRSVVSLMGLTPVGSAAAWGVRAAGG